MTELRPATSHGSAPHSVGAQVKINGAALAAIILSVLIPPAAIITGHVALRLIKKSGEDGYSLALAGTILGYVLTISLGFLVGFYTYLYGSLFILVGSVGS